MKIHESGENYLETILMLKNRIGQVRSIDIVREMDFSKPTVSVAMKRFREYLPDSKRTGNRGTHLRAACGDC